MLLITGATGHSGKWFLRKLEEKKFSSKIRCLVRQNSNITTLKDLSLEIEFCYTDLDSSDIPKEHFKDAKTVVHIAGIGYSDNIVNIGKKVGVEWFVLIHTTGRYSKFKSASAEYIEIEEKLIKENSNLTILRPTMIYGSSADKNMWKLVNFLNNYKFFPVFGNGNNLMQPVHARNLGNAYYNVINNKNSTIGKQYNLSGRDELSYKEILQTVSNVLNKKTVFIFLPFWFCLLAARVYNFIFRSKSIISVEQVMRMQEDKVFSWEKASLDFQYDPMTFQDGISEEVNELLPNN